MEKKTGRQKIENIYTSDQQVVTNLYLPKGKLLASHHVPYTVVVVPVKGKVVFSGDDFSSEIQPGDIIHMSTDEKHQLKALEDSQLMVIKSKLALEA